MSYWDGVSTIIIEGLKIKSPGYTYTIDKLLNDGASIVYKAVRDDGKAIFLKQFKEPTVHHDDFNEFIQFQHSVLKTLIQLPTNIVEWNYEYFECHGVHFHAKAFEAGKDLSDLIYEDKPDFAMRLHIAKVALGILKAVHKKGVVHSDLKPHQFFIINDSSVPVGVRVKLIDFDHCKIPSLNLSRTAGTAEWKSPEHVKNSNISFHSDVFTMGMIFYTLITGGRHPYFEAINNDTYDQDIITQKGYVPISDLFKGKIPPEKEPFFKTISDTIDSMIDPNASKRPSIGEVHQLILAAEKAGDAPVAPKNISLQSNRRSRLIVDTQVITREIVKSSFGNHNEIYNKQFEIMKDKSGEWFVKGFDVPPTAKDAKGNVYTFHKTQYNGGDVTNRYTKIEDGGIIKVGDVEFMVKAM